MLKKKKECRKTFLSILFRMINSKKIILFFDECCFHSPASSFKIWGEKGKKDSYFINNPNIFLKLIMITNLHKVISFSMSFNKINSEKTFQFIQSSIYFVRKKLSMEKKIIMVLDNAPKNRSKKLKDLSEKKWVSLLYTVPTTPQENFIVQIFGILKKKMNKKLYRLKLVKK